MAQEAKTESGLGRLARIAFVVVAAISIPLTIGLLGTAQLIVPWVMGAKYLQAIPLLRWISPYIVTASFASLLSGTVIYAMGHHRAYLVSAASGAIAGVILYALLIVTMGLRGACVAAVVAEGVVAGAAYWLLPKELHSSWRSPLVRYVVFASLLMLGVIRIISYYSANPLIVVGCGVFTYLLCAWSLKRQVAAQLASMQ
jgi:O-antigen/teichoic acid export membrane protein